MCTYPASEPFVDAVAAAAKFGKTAQWFYDQAKRGKLPHYRVGRSVRFRMSELEAYLREEVSAQ